MHAYVGRTFISQPGRQRLAEIGKHNGKGIVAVFCEIENPCLVLVLSEK